MCDRRKAEPWPPNPEHKIAPEIDAIDVLRK